MGDLIAPLVVVHILVAIPTAAHALLYKRHSRAALGWIVSILAYPLAGAGLYVLFGINRVRTRSRQLRDDRGEGRTLFHQAGPQTTQLERDELEALSEESRQLMRIGSVVTASRLVGGNKVAALHNGEEAFPAMLEAIRQAKHRVWLVTYIFETNAKGREFVEALREAHERGVDVRVIVDGIGEFYSWPHVSRLLQRAEIPHARFLPPRIVPPQVFINLRNHRKVLTVDGQIGFTGGMNLGGRHMVEDPATKRPVQDVHFSVEGPVVEQFEALFLRDWAFARREAVEPVKPLPNERAGNALCRTIPDGPDHDLNKLETVITSVIASSEKRVFLITPYFVPPEPIQSALVTAALRGVEVTVVVPEHTNLPYVHWAMHRMARWLLVRGVKIIMQPPPFSHAKVLLVDDEYVMVGSANMDARSLRLNFEIGLEVVDRELSENLRAYYEERAAGGHELTAAILAERSFGRRLLDGLFWLFSPYL